MPLHAVSHTAARTTPTTGTAPAAGATWPPLEAPPTQGPTETRADHGAALLRYILRTSITATLSDEDLTRAWHASQRAVTAPGLDPQIAGRLHAIRQQIQRAQRTRQDTDPAAQTPVQAPTAPQGGRQPGRPAPLVPPPTTRPPSVAYATPPPTIRSSTPIDIDF